MSWEHSNYDLGVFFHHSHRVKKNDHFFSGHYNNYLKIKVLAYSCTVHFDLVNGSPMFDGRCHTPNQAEPCLGRMTAQGHTISCLKLWYFALACCPSNSVEDFAYDPYWHDPKYRSVHLDETYNFSVGSFPFKIILRTSPSIYRNTTAISSPQINLLKTWCRWWLSVLGR